MSAMRAWTASGTGWGRVAPWLLLGAGLAAYANSLGGAFVFDDRTAIVENPHVRRLWPPTVPLSSPRETTTAGRPLLSLSFALNYAASGLDVIGYHVLNLAIHLAAGFVLFGLLRRTLRCTHHPDAADGLALAASLLWLIHPLQTESVTYLSQRAESLAGLWYLLTLYGAIRSAERPRPWRAVSILCCALGLATKETVVTAPLAVYLYDRTFLAGSFREAWRRRRGLYLGLAATWLVSAALLSTAPRPDTAGFGVVGVGPWRYLATQGGVLLHYLRLAVWPDPLVLDYGWPLARSLAEAALPWVVMGPLLGWTAWAVARRPAAGFWPAWAWLVLLPTSSVIPMYDAAFEHRMYLPLAGLVTLAALGGERLVRRATAPGARCPAPWIGVGLLVLAGIVRTAWRNEEYRSELALWRATVRQRPANARVHNNLGEALARQGLLDEAIPHFVAATRLQPGLTIAWQNLRLAYRKQPSAGDDSPRP